MHFSSLIPALGGLVAVAQASPHLLPGVGLGLDVDVNLGGKGADKDTDVPKAVESSPATALSGLGNKGGVPSTCSLANSWEDHTLFNGIAAPASGSSKAIHLGLNLPNAQIEGDATLELVKDFLKEPRVRIGLGGVKAYVEIDISASAAVHESIELFASSALELEIPGLLEAEAGAALALDLVVGVDAAIDVSAGVYLAFGEEAFVEVSLLTKEIVDVSLEGLVTKALPIGVGAEVDLSAEIELQLGLRLRTEIDLKADLDIPVLEIEAGAKIAVWVSLFEYTAVLIGTDNCIVSVDELIALTLGLAVELNVEIGDILDLSLAPTLTITLATAAQAKVCQPNRGTPGGFLEPNGKGNGNGNGDKTDDKTATRVISLSTLPAGGADNTGDYTVPKATDSTGVMNPEGTGSASGSDAHSVPSATGSASGSDAYPVPGATGSASGSDAYPIPGATGSASGSDAYPVPGATGSGSESAYPMPSATDGDAYPVGSEAASSGAGEKPSTTGSADAGVTPAATTGDVTRTLTSTHVYTVTSCAASVINCPARYTQKVVTSTISKTTYVCPATETGVPAATTTGGHHKVPVPVTTITDTLTTVVPCKTRTTKTFHPPTTPPPAPTVTIVDTTTYCPATDKTAQPTKPQSTLVKTTAVPTTEGYEKPTAPASVPQKPTQGKPVLPPAHSVPYPHPPSNGTVTSHVPVAPVPVPTTAVPVPPVVSKPVTPPVVSKPVTPPVVSKPVYPAPPAAETPVATPPAATGTPPPVSVSGGSVVRTGCMLALPAMLALFM
ncbi:hypothetical protein F53441_7589 [Fusarium austroafricanum]|uniref:Cell wall protein n=1 Tax=Fusarium austroafricanum TaxID=2364996 RepID=A0A8H4KD87_9HYPO|nr:hypothetical protein F53441_7589 [Fusarium austroafricanum]